MISLASLADLAARATRVSLAVGFFDGVHRGHRRVLTAAVARARAIGGEAWALTFEPHPIAVLDPARAPALLTPPALRDELLAGLGLDGIVVLPFTPAFAALSPKEFVERHLFHGDWAPEVVFAGTDWRFGAGGAGTLADLPALSGGRIRVRVIPELLDGGAPVSSTRIRAALSAGDLATANRLLGRPFRLHGNVAHGRAVGRTLAAATANLVVDNPGILAPGVYAASVPVGSSRFTAVVNIGVRPTFHDADSGKTTIEAHLLDFSGDLYGKTLDIEFLARLRDERAFESPEALAEQIQRDIEDARKTIPWGSGRNPVHCPFQAALRSALEAPNARVLQDGRNRTLLVPGAAPDGGDLVIKRFGKPSRLRRFLDRIVSSNGKVGRSYDAARYLTERGIPTPEPVGALPMDDPAAPGGALATRAVANLRSFHRDLVNLYAAHGPCEVLMDRLRAVAEFCADMHDAGFLHRDLGDQNLFFAGDPAEGRVMTLDLNRGRCLDRPLTLRERARDLSRIDLPSDLLRVFFEMYWRGDVPPKAFLRAERRYRRSFQFHCATRKLRHPLRERRKAPNPEGELPAPRDFWIWDERSVQAISAFKSRDRHRHQQPGRVWKTLVAAVSGLCLHGLRGRSRRFREAAFAHPVEAVGERLSIALAARPDTLGREISLLRELGAKNVLLRLYAHESPEMRRFTLEAARRLHEEGFGVAMALVQCRESVTDPAAWDALGRELLAAVAPFVRWVEVGHAVNRVKWGLWGYTDLRTLFAPLAGWRRDYPKVRFTGPSVIDFEPDFTQAALREAHATFDALSQHLYVDRRGAPENTQNGYDAVGKMALLRAIGEASGVAGDGLIVSEFNWPLLGEGVYSPVGSPYVSPGTRFHDPSVTEEEAAAYTVRFALLGIASGLAEEMVFWRLEAKGFGLVDDDGRKRPAFEALREWHKWLSGARFVERNVEPDGRIVLRFLDAGGRPFVVSWNPATAEMPMYASR